MKFLPLFLLLFFILLTHAQRRTTTAKSTADPDTPKPISRGRGRSRFVSPSEYSDPPSSTESSSRKTIASRRRVVENIEQKFPSRSSVASSTPKQAISTNANRRTASVVQTADTIFLNNDKVARPSLVENVGRNTPAPSTFRAFNKRPKNSYEVEETPDDIDPYRRKKPRVLTETNFKSSNFPKRALENSEPPSTSAKISKNLLTPDSPSPLSTLGNTNLLEEQLLDTTLKPELETPIGTLTEDEIQEETQKTIPVSSTVKPTEPPRPPGKRRTGVRKVVNRVTEPVIATPAPGGRVRTRNRPTQAPDFYFQSVSTSVPSTSFRRRVDSLFSAIEPRKGPSVFNADTTASESRSRTGRKIDLLPTEKIPSRGRRVTITPTTVKSTQTSTLRSRGGRFRSREMPIIDEQKLEVLPLFEEEPKIVPTRGLSRNENSDPKSKELKNADVTKSRTSNRDERTRHSNRADADSRSKNKVSFVEKEKPTIIKKENIDLNSRRRGYPADYIEASATETDMKITITAVNVESTTQPPKPSTPSRNTQVKESVTQEINEVTSRRKVSRKKVIKQKVPSFRGTKKSEVKLEKKHSSEEIGESDNYPEEFKALLKAKKEHKESRPSPLVSSSSPSTLSSTISVVTSSTPPSTTAYLLTTRQINDNDNEIKPKPSTPSPKITSTSPRWSRSRYSPSTTTQAVRDDSSTRRQSFRTTTSSTTLSRGTKHFITFPSRANSSVPKLDRNVSFKPRISNSENEIRRFNRGRNAKQPSESNVYSTKVPKYSTTVKKFDRGKYRSGSTTIAPKYIPTIPSVPYVPTVPIVTTPRTWVGASTYTKDDDLGLQVISIDEPVHAIPSANLVNGNYNVPTENSVTIPLPLVNGGTTEKPVSIIERIINSITARSTISPSTDTVTKITASTTESPSAILKLAPKRARQTDKTDDTRQRQNLIDTVSLTTENPTTIIEKILSSLNAIQATDKNGSVQDEQNTIPSDTNSLSTAASTTTRITSKLYKASSSAQSSTTVTTPSTSTIYSDSKPTSSLPMSTVLITGRTIEPSTVASNVNSAGTTLPDMVTVESSTVYSTTPEGKIDSTFPTLSGLLNGNILEAYNEIVNKTDNKNSDIPKSDGVKVNTYTQVLNIQDLIKNQYEDRVFNRRPILDKVDSVANLTSTLASTTVKSSTVETPKIEMSTQDSVLLSNKILDDTTTTIRTTTKPTKGRRFTSTPTIPTSTFFPIFLSTFFPNVFETTKFPIIPTTSPEGVIRISAAPSIDETLSTAASTTRPTTVRLTTARTTTEQTTAIPTTTRMRTTTTRTTTTTRPTTTTKATTTTRATTTARRRTTTPSTTTSAPTTRRTTARPRLTTTSPPIVTTTATPITSTYQTVTAASSTKRSATVADFNTIEVTTPKTIKLNELSKEQRENLKIIAQLEKEQAQLLQQLSFLTNLGLGANRGTKPPTNGNRKPNSSSKTLAERIVALAVERDKTTTVEPTIPTTTRLPNSIHDQLAALQTTRQPQKATSLDDVLKQLNLNGLNVATKPTEPTVKSEDAILNSLLREQGIIPPTPKSLAGIFDETPIRSRPRTPAPPPPGPLMRGLNWLLTALGPQPQPQIVPTRRPTRKPAKPTKPKKPPIDQELLANSPTHVTPVVTLAPSKTANALSQDDIKKLISQLEGIQKNPSKGTLDLSQIKSIQNLINLDEGVVVMTNGEHGTTSRRTSTAAPTTIRSRQPSQRQSTQRQPRKLPTEPPPLIVSVSNSVEEFDEFETTTNRVVRAPIGFRPVPGVDDDNPNTLVRSNLITAAVNVTKAISSFLGTALQGAASSFSSLFGGGSALGSRLLGNAALGSSAG